MTRSYRPSNGTEGEIFMAHFCDQCVRMRDDGRLPCAILGLVLGLPQGHPDYPAEWVVDENGNASCTAFDYDDGEAEPPARCPNTGDLFGGQS